ncbi:MAG: transcription elongation factor GreA [Anaerolineae bacterium]
MSTKEVFLTPEGRRKLEEELDFLVNVRRPEVAQRIKEAKEEGDVSENAGYDEAKQQQGFLEGRIQQIEMILKTAKMIDEPSSTDRVQLGSTVTVVESDGGESGPEETFRIVGSTEANPGKGLISNESPLGKSLLNKTVGNEISVQTPGGVLQFKIVSIR